MAFQGIGKVDGITNIKQRRPGSGSSREEAPTAFDSCLPACADAADDLTQTLGGFRTSREPRQLVAAHGVQTCSAAPHAYPRWER